MAALAEITRLRRQATEARDKLDALYEAREKAQEGGGIGPAPAEIDRARAALEAAEALLRAAERGDS